MEASCNNSLGPSTYLQGDVDKSPRGQSQNLAGGAVGGLQPGGHISNTRDITKGLIIQRCV